MNIIERTFRALSPERALRRAKAKRALEVGDRLGYWRQAAVAGTNRKMSGQALDHADSSRNHSDRITLIREARHLEENNAIIAGTLRKFEVFVVGRTTYIPRTQSEKVNKQIKAYVDRWMPHADLTGRHSFRALAGLAVKSELRDGDLGFIISEPTQEPALDGLKVCPIRLQAIEADRIGATWSGEIARNKPFKTLGSGEQEFSGVVVDKYGRPTRYRIFNRQKGGEAMVPWKEVEARNFLHIFDPIRFDGYRAVSVIDSCANEIKDAHEILACAKQTVKWQASRGGWIEGGDGTVLDDINLDGTPRDTTISGAQLEPIEPGAIKHLPAGHKFVGLDASQPGPRLNEFMETLIRLVAQAFKLPYGIVYSWASQGTAVRMESAMADREFQQKQLMLEERFLNPIIRRVIKRGIDDKEIDPVPDFDAGEWRYPAKATADVGRESKADIEEIMVGLRSRHQVAADHGEDYDLTRAFIRQETLDVIEDAKQVALASDGEIDLKFAAWMIERRGPNAPTEPPEPADNPDTPPAE